MIRNNNVAPNAAIDSWKLNFGKTSAPTAANRDGLDLAEGVLYYDKTLNALRVYNGSDWTILAQQNYTNLSMANAFAGGQKISDMSSGSFELECADTNNPTQLLTLDNNDTTNNPIVIKIENSGTGNDITSNNWSVNKSGVPTLGGIQLNDSKILYIGSSQDISVQWDATDLLIDGAAADTVLKIGATNNQNVQVYGATATNYVLFDTDDSALNVTFEHFHLELQDNSYLRFGDSDDITIRWNATDLLIEGAAADTVIKIGATNNQNVQIYAATATDYVLWDTDDTACAEIHEDFQITMMDDTPVNFGDSKDVSIDWKVGGGLYIEVVADNSVITVGDGTLNANLKLFGGDAAHFILFDCDGNTNGIWDFGADANGIDVRFYGDTTAKYLMWDESANRAILVAGAALNVDDDSFITFGTGTTNAGDFKITGTSAPVLEITQVASGTGTITVGADGKGIDLTLYSETASSYYKFDQANDRLVACASNMCFGDASVLRFGTGTTFGGDIGIAYTGGTNVLNIGQVAGGTGTITIGADGKGIATTFFGETASASMIWTQATDELVFTGGATPAFIRLANSTLAQLDASGATATGTAGMIAYCSNGAAGAPTLVFSDGANWLRADTLAAAAAA
jgi:hypothetical protein